MRFILTFGLGAVVGLAGAYAHFSGSLAPIYHKLGWHRQSTPKESNADGADATGGRTGHEGMSMPGMPGMEMGMNMGGAEPSPVPGHAIVAISPERQQLIGVRKGKVMRDKLVMSIRAVGIIEPDQIKLARVQTRVKGWVTKVFVNFVGQNVHQGDPLVEIYSPSLLEAQQEYLIALKYQDKAGAPPGETPLAASALRRLKLLGVPDDELEELVRSRKVRDTLTLHSPVDGRVLDRNVLEGSYIEPASELYRIADLSIVWLQAKLYEYELPHVGVGQAARVTLLAEPDREFQGRVSFIEPVVQELTRTIKVRVEIDNPQDLLKPGMYADLTIEHEMGEGLLVPESAVLRTGERDLAFRALAEGRFEPVEVRLGSRFGDRLEVAEGLSEGDEIVISAGFLIDSESRLKSTVAGGGHKHGQ
jgi:Cu(I)/Ag(I) efflux system membrane fusion protein